MRQCRSYRETVCKGIVARANTLRMNTTLTRDRLRQLVHYDPETGEFVRIQKAVNTLPDRVGGLGTSGYMTVSLECKRYYLHRLAWLYMTGEWPNITDHINGNKLDNRFANLRNVGHAENVQNQRRAQSNNETGYLGVQVCKAQGNFRAYIGVGGMRYSLGRFATPQEAHQAYLKAKRELHAGCSI